MNKICGVYEIKCLINNKIYIGSSVNIYLRFQTHKNHLSKNKHINEHLQSAWNLYGANNFSFTVIEESTEDLVLDREQYWMDSTNCYSREIGFNACKKADRPLGYKHNDESRIKMSKAKLGKKQSKESIEKRRLKIIGIKHTDTSKKNMSIAKLGNKNPMFNKKLTPEQRKEKGKNLNSVPRWNKGLTKNDDPRIAKLAFWTGKVTVNALKCKLINIQTNEAWEAASISALSKICPISISTLQRLKNNKAGTFITNTYKLEFS